MTWEGVGYAAKIDGRMDGDHCLQILKDTLQNSLIITLSIPAKRSGSS
jgi:hypothetical protein